MTGTFQLLCSLGDILSIRRPISLFLVRVTPKMTVLNRTLNALDTYKGRDRFLRLFCYCSKCAAGLVKSKETALQFDRFSKQLSTSRACFRLLDDIPVIVDIIRNCSNAKKKSLFEKLLFAIESIVDVIFSPLDHISWAIEHKIIVSNSTIWDSACTMCWVISLYINLYKIAARLSNLSKQKLEIRGTTQRNVEEKLSTDQLYLEMSGLKCLTDLLFAINYLPKGLLWAESLSKWQVGALGSLSSVVSLYQALVL